VIGERYMGKVDCASEYHGPGNVHMHHITNCVLLCTGVFQLPVGYCNQLAACASAVPVDMQRLSTVWCFLRAGCRSGLDAYPAT